MKLVSKIAVMGAFFSLAAQSQAAADLSVSTSVDLASSYVFRGSTLNKKASVQPAVEMGIGDSLSIGTWASLPMEKLEEEQSSEVDLYVSYSHDIGWASIDLGATEYIYPEDDADNDREISVGMSFDTLLSPSVTAYSGIAGAIENQMYYEAAISQGIYTTSSFEIDAGLTSGYLDPEEGEAGFSHLLASLTAGFGSLSASANYVIETDKDVLDLAGNESFYMALSQVW